MKLFPTTTPISTTLFKEIFVFGALFSHSKAFIA
jgi:hypothetical protein